MPATIARLTAPGGLMALDTTVHVIDVKTVTTFGPDTRPIYKRKVTILIGHYGPFWKEFDLADSPDIIEAWKRDQVAHLMAVVGHG